jgi:hypothetical protein
MAKNIPLHTNQILLKIIPGLCHPSLLLRLRVSFKNSAYRTAARASTRFFQNFGAVFEIIATQHLGGLTEFREANNLAQFLNARVFISGVRRRQYVVL